jgi:AraC-like DNA-binding protein
VAIGLLASAPVLAVFLAPAFTIIVPLFLPVLMSAPPLLRIYATELTEAGGTPGSRPGGSSFIPAGLGMIVSIGFWVMPSAGREVMLIQGDLPSGWFPSALALCAFVLLIAWSAWCLRDLAIIVGMLSRHRRRLKDFYSHIGRRGLKWLDALAAMLTATWLALIGSLLVENLIGVSLLSAEALLAIGCSLLVVLAGWGLRPPLPTEIPAEDVAPTQNEAAAGSVAKYARSALSAEQARRLASKIESAMNNDALYLDPNLSLSKLSKHIGASANLVSQTLNEQMGETFFDYVNRRRIKAAMPSITNGRETMLEIALAAGFNSRSTFYKAFKRLTGSTPRKYRELGALAPPIES